MPNQCLRVLPLTIPSLASDIIAILIIRYLVVGPVGSARHRQHTCPVLSCPVLSCPVLSCPILSYPVLSCPILSCPILSCPVLSCPTADASYRRRRRPSHPAVSAVSRCQRCHSVAVSRCRRCHGVSDVGGVSGVTVSATRCC